MAAEGKRHRLSAPQRSPQELAETLAALAAGTEDPRPRPRGRRATAPDADIVWSEPTVEQGYPDEAGPAPAEPEALALAEPEAAPIPTREPEPTIQMREPEGSQGLTIGRPLGGSASEIAVPPPVSDRPPLATGVAAAGARFQSRAAGRVGSRREARVSVGRPGPRRSSIRRLYPPLIALLVVLVAIALLSGGGGAAKPASPPHSTLLAPASTPAFIPPAPRVHSRSARHHAASARRRAASAKRRAAASAKRRLRGRHAARTRRSPGRGKKPGVSAKR